MYPKICQYYLKTLFLIGTLQNFGIRNILGNFYFNFDFGYIEFCLIDVFFNRKTVPDKIINVSLTPNGYADGIDKNEDGNEYFITPYEQKMTMLEFLDTLDEKR